MRRRERNRKPRSKRNWFLLPLLLVGGGFAAYGGTELLPVSQVFGIVWTAAAGVCLLVLAFYMVRRGGPPRRAETGEEADGLSPSDPVSTPVDEEEPAPDERLAIDAEISHEVYLRAKAADDARKEQEGRERLRQLRALRALESITEEEYEAERRKVWESM